MEIVKNLLAVGIFSLLIVFLARPFFQEGILAGHDTSAHLTYAKLFIQEINNGQFPVRWTKGVRVGQAQPLFNFYQVGFYYLVALVNYFFQNFIFSLKFSIIFLWWFGTIFTFLFLKKFGILSATLGTLVYTLSPYLIFDIYIRAAYPEFMAISFFPGLLYFLELNLKKPKIIYMAFSALFFGTIIFSHLPTTIIIFPLILGFIFLQILTKEAKSKGILFASLGLFLGIGISSFYLLPAVFELSSIQIHLLKSNGFDFHKNFLSFDFFKL